MLPIAGWFPVLAPPWDRWTFGIVLGLLLIAAWRYRLGTGLFLATSLLLALGDQSRWQPWFYMYWVMLLFTMANHGTAFTACRVALCAVYFWSGAQKCNPHYFDLVVPWFVKPASAWLPAFFATAFQWSIAAAPVVEMLLAAGLWFRRTRTVAVVTALIVHASALLFLGPLGHQHNWIIWPWNLAMPALVWILFPREPFDASRQTSGRNRWVRPILAIFCLAPILSFFGKWDSYLSFSLYTGHLTKADIFISEAARARLPLAVQEFAKPTPAPFNEQIQGPYVVLVELWADEVLKVPPLPEGRNYRNVARYLTTFADTPDDVRMVLIPRVGGILFYRGSDLRPEAGLPLAVP